AVAYKPYVHRSRVCQSLRLLAGLDRLPDRHELRGEVAGRHRDVDEVDAGLDAPKYEPHPGRGRGAGEVARLRRHDAQPAYAERDRRQDVLSQLPVELVSVGLCPYPVLLLLLETGVAG